MMTMSVCMLMTSAYRDFVHFCVLSSASSFRHPPSPPNAPTHVLGSLPTCARVGSPQGELHPGSPTESKPLFPLALPPPRRPPSAELSYFSSLYPRSAFSLWARISFLGLFLARCCLSEAVLSFQKKNRHRYDIIRFGFKHETSPFPSPPFCPTTALRKHSEAFDHLTEFNQTNDMLHA